MPTLCVNNITINYIEANSGAGQTIFFVHGNSLSAQVWHRQLDARALSTYRLVAFDLPANGQSGVAPNPAETYTAPGLAAVMAGAVQQLANGKPYILAGISLGTSVVAEMLLLKLTPAGIILASPCIIGGAINATSFGKPGADLTPAFTDNPDAASVQQYLNILYNGQDAADTQMLKHSYYAVQAPFRSMLLQSIIKGTYSDEIAAVKAFTQPVLVIFGQNDNLLNISYLNNAGMPLWNNAINTIPNAGHLSNLEQADAFNKVVADYAGDVIK